MKNNCTLFKGPFASKTILKRDTFFEINYLNIAESKLSENKLSESILAGFLLFEAKEDTI